MEINFIDQIPMPACVVDEDGRVAESNGLIKNVFLYEDIKGSKFFTLTGVKRAELLEANENEIVIERNDRYFKLRTNIHPEADKEIVVIFDEATARESFRNKLEKLSQSRDRPLIGPLIGLSIYVWLTTVMGKEQL